VISSVALTLTVPLVAFPFDSRVIDVTFMALYCVAVSVSGVVFKAHVRQKNELLYVISLFLFVFARAVVLGMILKYLIPYTNYFRYLSTSKWVIRFLIF